MDRAVIVVIQFTISFMIYPIVIPRYAISTHRFTEANWIHQTVDTSSQQLYIINETSYIVEFIYVVPLDRLVSAS